MNMNRREFLKVSAWTIAGTAFLPGLTCCQFGSIRFGWVTDIHYALAPIKWGRYFSESKEKLSEAITLFNQSALDFVIETGDFKDQNEPAEKRKTQSYLKAIEAVFSQFNGPRYHVLGNHDLDSLSKMEFQSIIQNSGISPRHTYYWFEVGGYRFIVLDACFREDEMPYDNNNFKWYDTFIPKYQLDWLKHTLYQSRLPVVVFTHQLLDGEGELYVKNAPVVRKVLENSGVVTAVFQGHKHEGDYNLINSIHYITQKAMVEGSGAENSSYSIVELTNNGEIIIEGYRKAESYEFIPEIVPVGV